MKQFVPALLLLCSTATTSLAVTVTVSVQDDHCGLCNGSAVATATGGLPPYSYLWSPTPPSGQGTPNISGLCPGDYTVEVTDGLGSTAQTTVTINSLGTLAMNLYAPEIQYACAGQCTGWASINQSIIGGTPPYSYSFPFPQYDMFGMNTVAFAGLCPGETIINVSDANGCTGTIATYINSSPMGSPGILATSPACASSATGSITVEGGGPGAQTAYLVSGPSFDSLYVLGEVIGPAVLGGIPPGTHFLDYWWVNGGITGEPGIAYCTQSTPFTIASFAGPCGSVAGRVYHDAEENCIFNGFDFGQPYRVLAIEPGGHFTITDANGLFQRNLDLGTYAIQQPLTPDENELCPATGSAAFTLDNATPSATVDFANLSTVPHDLSVTLNSTNARPGFGTQVWMTVVNNSAFASGQLNIALAYDAILLDPSNASWSLPAITPYGSITFTFTANVPADIGLLGANLNYGATVTNAATEQNTTNNTTFLDVTVTGSYDPNDKQGNTSSALSANQYFLDQDEWIDYTVRFQNTGTAAAETVTIRDVIDEDLFIPSLQIMGASHAFTPSFGEGRELVFTFANIDLPDSTTDLLGSQGFISFRLKPNDDIIVGDVLENTAGIYFDFNQPIITNTVSHVVDFSTGSEALPDPRIQLWPNPTTGILHITLPGGSRSFRILTADGREVLSQRTTGGPITQVDVSTLTAGPYVLQATMRNGSLAQTRFIRTNAR